jgi:hypothetical protein
LKLDYEIEKHQIKNQTNGSTQQKPHSEFKTKVGEKRNHGELTQTQQEQDVGSITSYSGDEHNGNAGKRQRMVDEESSDL